MYIMELRSGTGSLKDYKYWTGGIVLISKKSVKESIKLKLRLLRKDKITKEVTIFNYKTLSFDNL